MYVERPGARIFHQTTGTGGRDVFLCPPRQPAIYGRMWKNQIPYLSRYFRVTTMDPRGNGRSDRPLTGYDFVTHYDDLRAVLDAAVRPPFAFVAFSCASMLAVRYAIDHPERVSHLIFVGAQYSQSLPQPFEEKVVPIFRNDFDGWRTRLFQKIHPEPHSLKGIEDGIAWAGETSPDILVEALRQIQNDNVYDLLPRLTTPVLILHGTKDEVVPYRHGKKFAEAVPGARLVTFEGGGHNLPGREAAKVNRLLRDFVRGEAVESTAIPTTTERRAPAPGRSARSIRMRPSTSWPPIPPGAWSRSVGSACIRPRASSSTRAPTSRAGRPPIISSTRSTRSGTWTRSWRRTSWSSRMPWRPATTTSGSATRGGTSTTTCTRTPR